MATYLTRPRTLATTVAVLTAACGVSPAFAAISPSVDQWDQLSGDLLYGSIALLVAGVLGKMFTYRNAKRPDVMKQPRNEWKRPHRDLSQQGAEPGQLNGCTL